MKALDLSDSALATVRAILSAHVPGVEVWAFGSRVNGTAHAGSDLDLVVRNPGGLEVADARLGSLRSAFSDSDLPFLVDVIDWARIPESFRSEIERQHVALQTAQ